MKYVDRMRPFIDRRRIDFLIGRGGFSGYDRLFLPGWRERLTTGYFGAHYGVHRRLALSNLFLSYRRRRGSSKS